MTIERHKIDVAWAKEMFEKAVSAQPRYLAAARENAKNLPFLIDKSLQVVRCGSVVEPTSPHIPAVLLLAVQAHAALFSTVFAEKGEKTATLGDSPVTFTTTPDESVVHVGRWTRGFYLAMLCGDEESLDALCAIPMDSLRRSTTKGDESTYLNADALQALHLGEAEVIEKIILALEATSAEGGNSSEWALYLIGYQLEVLMRLLTEDGEFSQSLANALQKHKEYWSKTLDRRTNPQGFLSEELTALAAMANRRGLSFTVDSPYLALGLAL